MVLPTIGHARWRLAKALRDRQVVVRFLPWAAPPVVFLYLLKGGAKGLPSPELLIGAAIGAALFAVVLRYSLAALRVVLVLIPFQTYIFSLLYRVGFSASILTQAVRWKELAVLGITAVAIHRFARSHRRFDMLDRLILGYVGISLLFLFVPQFLIRHPVDLTFSGRLFGWRNDALPIVLLWACRHLRLTRDDLRKVTRSVVAVTGVVAGLCVFEFFFSNLWNTIAVHWFQVTRYNANVLGYTVTNPNDIRVYNHIAGHKTVRIGGVLLDYLTIGSYLVIGGALILQHTAARKVRTWQIVVLLCIAGAVIFSKTRVAFIAGGLVALMTLRSTAKRNAASIMRYIALLVLGLIVAVPVIVASGAANRLLGSDVLSDTNHQASFTRAVSYIASEPLGHGLGSSAGAGQRYLTQTVAVIAENQYLQYGIEMGVVAMALFLALSLLLIRRLRQVARSDPSDLVAPAARTALIGVLVGAWFLQTLAQPAVAWTLFGLAGAALGYHEGRLEEQARHGRATPARAVSGPAQRFLPVPP